MHSYNKSSPLKYKCYQFEKLIEHIDIFKCNYHIVSTIRSTSTKATFLATNKVGIMKIVKAKLIDFAEKDELDIYRLLKNNFHPYISQIVSIYKTSKLILTTSKYINGFAFHHLKQKKVTDEMLLEILKKIMYGIQYLHNLDIGHGDISPNNIIIDKHDGVYKPYIIDFDHAIILSKQVVSTEPIVGGTYGFVPPEYAVGIKNDKSDIWSLGETFKSILPETSNSKTNLRNIIDLMTLDDYKLRPCANELVELLEGYK